MHTNTKPLRSMYVRKAKMAPQLPTYVTIPKIRHRT